MPRKTLRRSQRLPANRAFKEVDCDCHRHTSLLSPQHLESVVAAGKHVYPREAVAWTYLARCVSRNRQARRWQAQPRRRLPDSRTALRFVDLSAAFTRRARNLVCGEAHYLTGYIDRPAWPNASPRSAALRNWVYDRALPATIIVDKTFT